MAKNPTPKLTRELTSVIATFKRKKREKIRDLKDRRTAIRKDPNQSSEARRLKRELIGLYGRAIEKVSSFDRDLARAKKAYYNHELSEQALHALVIQLLASIEEVNPRR